MTKNQIEDLIEQYKSMSVVQAIAYFVGLPVALIAIALSGVTSAEHGLPIPNETVAFSMEVVPTPGVTDEQPRVTVPIQHLHGIEGSRECVPASGIITSCAAP